MYMLLLKFYFCNTAYRIIYIDVRLFGLWKFKGIN